YDIVVGPPGSPLQLVLNAVYFLDNPTGVMAYEDYERLKQHEDVVNAFPVGLGDTYRGFRIVGTEREIFDYPWTHPVTGEDRYPFRLKEGKFFDAPMEAVVGNRVARNLGLKLGDTFSGTHGSIELPDDVAVFDHSDETYTVVGILNPSGTSNDRAIFVSLSSVWDLHAEHDETDSELNREDKLITAILVDLYSPALRFSFLDYVMAEYKATAAIPVIQIMNLYNQILGPAVVLMMAVGYVVVVISALSILIGLYLSIIQRKRDLAIMRALGAGASDIFGAVLIEAFLVTIFGIAFGWVLGKTVSVGLGIYMGQHYGFAISGLSTSSEEIGFFAIVAFVGLIAGILPAWQAYQTDIAKNLSVQ
ncbi:MAG: ABC transporter permease, partial [Candidatus Hydrogenedentes bacterium]|nr:ABC transporter permease [Candidatus Hydrogenedentota bacterium]